MSTRMKVYAGILVQDGDKVLLVKHTDDYSYSIPGGKVLWGEFIKDTALREFKEETMLNAEITSLLGVFQRKVDEDEVDYLRFLFIGKLKSIKKRKYLDETIEKVEWIKIDDILNKSVLVRSDQVINEIKRLKNGVVYPLEILDTYSW